MEPSAEPVAHATSPRGRRWKRKLALLVAVGIGIWLVVAYLVMPAFLDLYDQRHPSLENIPGITYAADGVPGDPLNVSLVGHKADIIKIMLAAQWHPADPLSLRSCLEIAEATIFSREYDDAPVSSLWLFGRKEDLAFEQPVGANPRHRHHVRFWQSDQLHQGRPVWMGSATYDQSVGLSHRTGEITHHIAEDVDAERNHLFEGIERTLLLAERYVVDDFHKTCEGRNGGGDPWRTDGKLFGGIIAAPAMAATR